MPTKVDTPKVDFRFGIGGPKIEQLGQGTAVTPSASAHIGAQTLFGELFDFGEPFDKV